MKHLFLITTFCLLTKLAFSQFTPLIFNFDRVEPVYIDTSLANNIWQIGPPQKTIFNSPKSSPNAILTDTINTYPNNNWSEFVVKTPTYVGAGWGGIEFRFAHKYDTDTINDGGKIEVSFDGTNWTNIINTPYIAGLTRYYNSSDTVSSLNDNGFSGNSHDWENTHAFFNFPPTDTLYFKFVFASDNNQNNREGWMIDNIRFDYNFGIGISESFYNNSIIISPNPFTHRTILEFENSINKNLDFVLFDIEGKVVRTINNISTDKVTIERENLSTGLYIYQLLHNERIQSTGKLIIE